MYPAEHAVVAEVPRTPSVDAVLGDFDSHAPLMVVTGARGTGKTAVCHALAGRFGPRTFGCLALTPPPTVAALMQQLLLDFGLVDATGADRSPTSLRTRRDSGEALRAFLKGLATIHGRAVIVIDDAHDLPSAVLIELLRIAETRSRHPLARVVLVGREQTAATLERPDVRRSLEGTAIFRRTLLPLAEDEIRNFMERRFWGARGGTAMMSDAVRVPRLGRAALRAIARATGGNPGAVSEACDRILAVSEGDRPILITRLRARNLMADLGFRPKHRLVLSTASTAGAVLAGLAVAALLSGLLRNKPIALRSEGSGSPASAQHEALATFEVMRADAIDRAARLSAVPDVAALVMLRDDIAAWDAGTKYAEHEAVRNLLNELDRLTNEARKRQLAIDGRLLRERPSTR